MTFANIIFGLKCKFVEAKPRKCEKCREPDPEYIMKVLNNTERKGGLGTPIKILFGQKVKGSMPNSNKEELDIQGNLQKRSQKAEKVVNAKGHSNRETFLEGDKV